MKRLFYRSNGRIVATVDVGRFGLAILTLPTGQTQTLSADRAKAIALSLVGTEIVKVA
jgi:hypothetical protein